MSPIPFTQAPGAFIASACPELIVKNSFLDVFDGSPMMLERGKSAPAYLSCADTDSACADTDSDGNAQVAAGALTPGGEDPAEGGWADQVPGMENIFRTETSDGWNDGTEQLWDGYHKDVVQADQVPGMDNIVRTVTSDGWNEGTEQRWDGYHKGFVQLVQSLEESLLGPQNLAMVPHCAVFCPAGPGAIAPRMPPPLEAPSTPTTPPATPAAPSLPPMLPRPLGVELDVNGLHPVLRWTADARKLKSNDREAVSPEFQLTFQQEQAVKFKMVIRPTAVSTLRGGMAFKKAKGKGSIELRCLDAAIMIPPVSFRLAVCSGRDLANPELPPGAPVSHDFKTRTICLGQEEWDFTRAVDEATQTFVVCLEILPGSVAAASAATP